MDITIRRMTEQDIDNVYNLEKESFSCPWSRQAFIETLEKECYDFFVVYAGDEHVATAGFTYTKPEADISNVCVKDSYRHRGIASRLLEYMIDTALGEGVNAFTLEVRCKNENAIGLYKKVGFKEEGVRKNFYTNPQDDALIMWRR